MEGYCSVGTAGCASGRELPGARRRRRPSDCGLQKLGLHQSDSASSSGAFFSSSSSPICYYSLDTVCSLRRIGSVHDRAGTPPGCAPPGGGNRRLRPQGPSAVVGSSSRWSCGGGDVSRSVDSLLVLRGFPQPVKDVNVYRNRSQRMAQTRKLQRLGLMILVVLCLLFLDGNLIDSDNDNGGRRRHGGSFLQFADGLVQPVSLSVARNPFVIPIKIQNLMQDPQNLPRARSTFFGMDAGGEIRINLRVSSLLPPAPLSSLSTEAAVDKDDGGSSGRKGSTSGSSLDEEAAEERARRNRRQDGFVSVDGPSAARWWRRRLADSIANGDEELRGIEDDGVLRLDVRSLKLTGALHSAAAESSNDAEPTRGAAEGLYGGGGEERMLVKGHENLLGLHVVPEESGHLRMGCLATRKAIKSCLHPWQNYTNTEPALPSMYRGVRADGGQKVVRGGTPTADSESLCEESDGREEVVREDTVLFGGEGPGNVKVRSCGASPSNSSAAAGSQVVRNDGSGSGGVAPQNECASRHGTPMTEGAKRKCMHRAAGKRNRDGWRGKVSELRRSMMILKTPGDSGRDEEDKKGPKESRQGITVGGLQSSSGSVAGQAKTMIATASVEEEQQKEQSGKKWHTTAAEDSRQRRRDVGFSEWHAEPAAAAAAEERGLQTGGGHGSIRKGEDEDGEYSDSVTGRGVLARTTTREMSGGDRRQESGSSVGEHVLERDSVPPEWRKWWWESDQVEDVYLFVFSYEQWADAQSAVWSFVNPSNSTGRAVWSSHIPATLKIPLTSHTEVRHKFRYGGQYLVFILNAREMYLSLTGDISLINPNGQHLSTNQLKEPAASLFLFVLYSTLNVILLSLIVLKWGWNRQTPLHLLMLASAVVRACYVGIDWSNAQRYSAFGQVESWRWVIPRMLGKIEDIVSLMLFLLLALGWRVFRQSLTGIEVRLCAALCVMSFYLGVFEVSMDQFQISRYILHAMTYLSIIVAASFDLAILSSHVSELGVSLSTGESYRKLTGYRIFRWVFVVFIIKPTLLLLYKICILEPTEGGSAGGMSSDWIILLLDNLFDLGILIALIYAFQPIKPLRVFRVLFSQENAAPATAEVGALSDDEDGPLRLQTSEGTEPHSRASSDASTPTETRGSAGTRNVNRLREFPAGEES